jgi:hypothetical protein
MARSLRGAGSSVVSLLETSPHPSMPNHQQTVLFNKVVQHAGLPRHAPRSCLAIRSDRARSRRASQRAVLLCRNRPEGNTQAAASPRFSCFFANYSRLVKIRQVGQGRQLTHTVFPIFKWPNQLTPIRSLRPVIRTDLAGDVRLSVHAFRAGGTGGNGPQCASRRVDCASQANFSLS